MKNQTDYERLLETIKHNRETDDLLLPVEYKEVQHNYTANRARRQRLSESSLAVGTGVAAVLVMFVTIVGIVISLWH